MAAWEKKIGISQLRCFSGSSPHFHTNPHPLSFPDCRCQFGDPGPRRRIEGQLLVFLFLAKHRVNSGFFPSPRSFPPRPPLPCHHPLTHRVRIHSLVPTCHSRRHHVQSRYRQGDCQGDARWLQGARAALSADQGALQPPRLQGCRDRRVVPRSGPVYRCGCPAPGRLRESLAKARRARMAQTADARMRRSTKSSASSTRSCSTSPTAPTRAG